MKKQGFTLIELMMAVAIIAILAMITIPQSRYVIARAQSVEAVIAIKTYERVQSAYYTVEGKVGTLAEMGLELPASGRFAYAVDGDAALSGSPRGGIALAAKGGVVKVDLCHVPPGNPENAHVITVGSPAYGAHLAHGDAPAPCPAPEASSSASGTATGPSATSSESATASSGSSAVASPEPPGAAPPATTGYNMPVILITATVLQPIAFNCRVGDAIFSEWTPLGVTRGDINTGSCTNYMGSSFAR